jgi:hypothetical protein
MRGRRPGPSKPSVDDQSRLGMACVFFLNLEIAVKSPSFPNLPFFFCFARCAFEPILTFGQAEPSFERNYLEKPQTTGTSYTSSAPNPLQWRNRLYTQASG